jgi:hypothetical protein
MINEKSMKNLKPWQPGECGNKSGKPPGAIDLKKRLNFMFVEQGAEIFAETIWSMCIEDRNTEMIKCVLKIAGALEPTGTQVNIQSNTLISNDVIELARQLISNRASGSLY